MTQKQHYMTEKERYQLEAYLRAKKPVAWIARELGFCRQTIYNELRRGSYIHTCKWWEEVRYSADKGQQAALQKRRNKGRPVKVPRDSEHWRFLEARLIGEQTDGRIKKKTRCSPAVAIELARRAGFPVICVNTLYSYIYQGRMGRAKACNLWEAPYRRKNEGRNSRVVHPQLPSISITRGISRNLTGPSGSEHFRRRHIVSKAGTVKIRPHSVDIVSPSLIIRIGRSGRRIRIDSGTKHGETTRHTGIKPLIDIFTKSSSRIDDEKLSVASSPRIEHIRRSDNGICTIHNIGSNFPKTLTSS